MKLIEHFLRLIAPDECFECGSEGTYLCHTCAVKVLEAIPERCYRCYRVSEGSRTCGTCRQHSVIRAVYIRTLYVPGARKLVHNLKFTYSRDAAKVIAYEMYTSLPNLSENTIIMHVPAVSSHIRQRGFDQSALIARELATLLHIPHVNGLARLGQKRQVGASRSVRLMQMKGVFRAISLGMVKGANILLIDDVITTGSTLEAAAVELKRSGAKSVSAACFAQAK